MECCERSSARDFPKARARYQDDDDFLWGNSRVRCRSFDNGLTIAPARQDPPVMYGNELAEMLRVLLHCRRLLRPGEIAGHPMRNVCHVGHLCHSVAAGQLLVAYTKTGIVERHEHRCWDMCRIVFGRTAKSTVAVRQMRQIGKNVSHQIKQKAKRGGEHATNARNPAPLVAFVAPDSAKRQSGGCVGDASDESCRPVACAYAGRVVRLPGAGQLIFLPL